MMAIILRTVHDDVADDDDGEYGGVGGGGDGQNNTQSSVMVMMVIMMTTAAAAATMMTTTTAAMTTTTTTTTMMMMIMIMMLVVLVVVMMACVNALAPGGLCVEPNPAMHKYFEAYRCNGFDCILFHNITLTIACRPSCELVKHCCVAASVLSACPAELSYTCTRFLASAWRQPCCRRKDAMESALQTRLR